MNAVLDCSAAIEIARGTERGGCLRDAIALDMGGKLMAPELYYAEVGSACSKYYRAGITDMATTKAIARDALDLVDETSSARSTVRRGYGRVAQARALDIRHVLSCVGSSRGRDAHHLRSKTQLAVRVRGSGSYRTFRAGCICWIGEVHVRTRCVEIRLGAFARQPQLERGARVDSCYPDRSMSMRS